LRTHNLDSSSHLPLNNLDEFSKIPTSGRDCNAAAKMGGRKPSAAIVSPKALYSNVKPMLPFTTRIVRRAI